MAQGTVSYRSWLKGNVNMKLSTDSAVKCFLAEGATSYKVLADFDTAAIQALPKICREDIPAIAADANAGIAAEAAVNGANINSISIQRLIVAANASRYYNAIDRVMTEVNMHYTNVLSTFKIEWEAHESVKKEDDPIVPKINDKLGDRKVIHWAPIFADALLATHGPRGPLAYVLRENPDVPAEVDDALAATAYYGKSGSLTAELVARLPHTGPIYNSDNATVYLKIEEACRGTSVESTIKPFGRKKDGRGAYLALLSSHAGESKHRSIAKKRTNFLANVKWTGQSHPLETHVSHQRQSYDDLRECKRHVSCQVPLDAQRVEFLIDSITSKDQTLQAVIGLIRANTNNMRNNFELAASALIEVDPYKRGSRNVHKNANISALDFNAGRGATGVDLRFHPRDKFHALPDDQKDELTAWLSTADGKKHKREYFAAKKKEKKQTTPEKKRQSGANSGNWKKKMHKAMQSEKGLKQVMSIMADEEKSNQALVSAIQSAEPVPEETTTKTSKSTDKETANASSLTARFPATSVRLQSILKR